MRLAVSGLTLGAVLLIWSVLPAVAETPSNSPAELGDGTKSEPAYRIEWRTLLAAALKEAADSGRLVLVYFHADWCQPCRLMDDGTFTTRGTTLYVAQHFVPVRIDDSKETSDVSKKYEIRLYPSILFLAAGGDPLHIVLGPRTPAQLYPILKQVAALPKLIEAQAKAPDDPKANFDLGGAWAILDQLKKAEPYLRRVVEKDPGNALGHLDQARLILAMVPIEDGDSALALKNLDQFIADFKDSPQRANALMFKGIVLYRDGRLEEARQVFDQLRTDYPKHSKAYEADKAIEAIDARLKAKAAENAPAAKNN